MISKQILILGAFIFIVEYYTFIALKTVIRNTNQGLHLTLIILYIVLSLGTLWGLFSFPRLASTEWPSMAIKYTVNIFIGVFLGKVLVAAIMLLGDVMVVFSAIFKFIVSLKGSPAKLPAEGAASISRFTFVSQTALFLGAALTSGLVYGMTNRYRYKLRTVRLPLTNLPDGLKGLRIAQISDIHSGSFDDIDAVSDGIEAIMREKPDLILFTGDLVNNRAVEIEPYLKVFGQLKAPLGVYSVLGNHDYGDYVSWPSPEAKQENMAQLKKYHAAMGWHLLLNEHVVLQNEKHRIALIGVENWSGKAGFSRYGNMEKAVTGLERTDIPLKILLSHDPSHWDAEVRKVYPDIALTLSGHTHGMQFGIDLPGLKWSPVQYIYKQWAGLYQQKDQYLYVNRGFGFIGYQGRLGILPEITLIELG
jgi:hypothetical protein